MAEQSSNTTQRGWTITGASAETREKVRAAAEAEGISIRAWVDKTLNAAADGRLRPVDGPASIAVDPKTLADISDKLDKLANAQPKTTKASEKAKEKALAQNVSAQVLKVLAGGFQEMQRQAKEQARIAESKTVKKKRKKPVAADAPATTVPTSEEPNS